MDNIAYIEELIARARKAQEAISDYTQEQTDALVKAIGKTVYDNREVLSQEAKDETGLGVVPSKIVKHANIAMYHWQYMKGKKSVGVIDEDPVNGIVTFAKPMGVVACITPTTNPTTTAFGNSMCAVKGRNAVIVAPHPRAKDCTAHVVALMSDAIVNLGGPADLIQTLESPSIELTNLLISRTDVTVATGGKAMVTAAYSSGKPSYGVGQGNVQVVVDEDYGDYETLTARVMGSRCYDNGMPCTGEQSMAVPVPHADAICQAFVAKGAYLVTDPKEIALLRKAAFRADNGAPNVDIVGKPAVEVAAYAGFTVPADTKLLLVRLEKHGRDELLSREIMCPILRVNAYKTFEEGVELARENLLMEGAGHTAIIYSTNDAHIRHMGNRLPVSRILVCQSGSNAGGNTLTNGLIPTISLGCGSWGGNSISENLNYKQLINTTRVSYIIPGEPLNPDEIWA